MRIPLRGRRVGGWVTELQVAPAVDAGSIQPVAKVSSDGPPPELVALAEWAAWRWAGPVTTFLRAASPPNTVRPGSCPDPIAGGRTHGSDGHAGRGGLVGDLTARSVGLLLWPPAARMAELVRRMLAEDGSTIVALPDPRRAATLVRFLADHGVHAVGFHALQSPAERTVAWDTARRGGCVVVGGRIAAWAPVPDLAAAVVIDEGDEALAEERAPTWNARDVLAERARRAGARLTALGAVPSLEMIEMAGGLDAAVRPPRVDEREGWARLVVTDRREEPPGAGLFSEAFVAETHRALQRGRVVCVLNRKGRARLLVCGQCGSVAECEHCGASMVEVDAGLACRRCERPRPRVCAGCGSTALKRLRPGVARIREELAALFPRADVAEVTAGSEDVPDVPVLVGTESVLHRVEDAALVAFLDFDQELLAARFRAGEQAARLLARAVRLVGPRSGPGVVLVQTRRPDHPVVTSAAEADLVRFLDHEAEARRALAFPPFAALAELSGDREVVTRWAALLEGDVDVLGPIVDGDRADALVRAPTHQRLCDALGAASRQRGDGGRPRVEVDPLRA